MIPRFRALTAAALAATTIFAAAGPQLAGAVPLATCPTTAYKGDVEVPPYTTCILTVAVKGNITVDDYATLELEGAAITGNITVHGGGALFSDYSSANYDLYPCGCGDNGPFGTYQDTGKHSSVSGSIVFNDVPPNGASPSYPPVLILINTSVGKSVTANGFAPEPYETDPFQLAICGSSIGGGLTLNSITPLFGAFIGDPADLNNENENEFPQFDGHCAGNSISNGLTATNPNLMAIEGNRGSGSYISGGLHVTGGHADIDGNTISGGATCTNTPVFTTGWDGDILVPNTISGAKTGTGC